MLPARQRATDYLLWTAALAWPLEVFIQTPVLGLNLFSLVTLLLLTLLLPDALAARKLHVPFEAWAPAAIIAGLAAFSAWTEPSPADRDAIEAVLLFGLVIEAGPSRDAIRRYVFAGVISVSIVTLISLLTPWLGLLPTAFSLRSGAAFTFPFDLAGGVHILLVGAASGVYIISDRRYRPAQRAVATASLILIATLLVGQGVHWWRDTSSFPILTYLPLSPARWAAAALALWLFARVVVKVELQDRGAPDPLGRLWRMAAVATVLVAACAPLQPRAYQGLLLGLACASALPERSAVRGTRWPLLGSAVLTVLLTVNLLFVFPENTSDPRQYDAAATRERPRVFDRMDWVDRHAPHERRTYLWRARAALEYSLPNLASFAFERAVRPLDGWAILEPPTEPERQAFLVQVRDVAAALPADRAVCAYERVLLSLGERDAALFSLRLQLRRQSETPLIHVPTADAPPFAAVAGVIVGDPLLAEDLRTWTADEVVTLLIRWGADAAFASDTDANAAGLLILAAQRRWDVFSVYVRAGERVMRFEEPLAPVSQRETLALAGLSVMAWSGPDAAGASGETRYTLNVADARGVRPAAYVDLRDDGPASFRWAENHPAIAFTPAVRIRLSK
jgi:hypothetical protein